MYQGAGTRGYSLFSFAGISMIKTQIQEKSRHIMKQGTRSGRVLFVGNQAISSTQQSRRCHLINQSHHSLNNRYIVIVSTGCGLSLTVSRGWITEALPENGSISSLKTCSILTMDCLNTLPCECLSIILSATNSE